MSDSIKSPEQFPFLIASFIEAMNDIGRLGEEKYGADSFFQRARRGDKSRHIPRTSTQVITDHTRAHLSEYQNGILHDVFKTRKHQLAAVAFNAMMEYYFADLENKEA